MRRSYFFTLAAAMLSAICLVPRQGVADGETSTEGDETVLPIPIPERPFLLLEASQRYTPQQPAEVYVQLRDGGRVDLAVFRIKDSAALLHGSLGAWRQGVAVVASSLGKEAERLLEGPCARPSAACGRTLPRRGEHMVLVRQLTARISNVRRPKVVGWQQEEEVFDTYKAEEEVATAWVRREQWGKRRVPLGRLPAGLYLVRALRGSWATAAYLSVGRLTLLVRRGDRHDVALVTDPDGTPQKGLRVEARSASGTLVASARTGADGVARLPPADMPTLRFLVRHGDDLAWTDVTHTRLAPCDPRVYLATGRPVYRYGETIYLRGHIRGCGAHGFSALANEPIILSPARRPDKPGRGDTIIVRSNQDGNFTAELIVDTSTITARLRGRKHQRTIQIDHRELPTRRLAVHLDRSWAASGQVVTATVADEDDGWPQARPVTLRSPAGTQRGRIGPGQPAYFSFRVPDGLSTLHPAEVSAIIDGESRNTTATAQLWIGSSAEVLNLHADRTWAGRHESVPVRLSAASLSGHPVSGAVLLALYGSDGNRPHGSPRWRGQATLGPRETTSLIPLRGGGPWWIEARRGKATATTVIWDSPKPTSLSARGPLAVRPMTRLARAGQPLAVEVRLPGHGGAWVTLEQGSVWSMAAVAAAGRHRTVSTRLDVPPQARGLASVVVSWIARGRVQTTTATVEVETSRELDLTVATDRRIYPEGAKTHVTLQARGADHKPRDAVVSIWLADAGYWELGADRYPGPNDFFTLPGRMSSAGDSSAPLAFGAEEGRHLDTLLRWNGKELDRATFRHGWGHGGELVTLQVNGSLSRVATRLARAAGLAGAWVCPDAEQTAGQVSLEVRALPWDLVALQVADQTETAVRVERTILRFECGAAGHGGAGAGHGLGSLGTIGKGGGGGGSVREQRLDGTVRFIGLRRLGPSGHLELDLRLPSHPGRWRVESLAIADDGGGDRAHAVVHTIRPLHAALDLPGQVRLGDTVTGALQIEGQPALRGKPVTVHLALPQTLRLLSSLPVQATLDRSGRISVPLKIRAVRSGEDAVVLSASVSKNMTDRVGHRISVLHSTAAHPVDLQAVVGPGTSSVVLAIPPLAQAATVHIAVNDDPLRRFQEALTALRRPRWLLPALIVDRLASLNALRAASRALSRATGTAASPSRRFISLQGAIAQEIASDRARLEQLQAPDGGVSWWTTLRSDVGLTAQVLFHANASPEGPWLDALKTVRRAARGWVQAPPASGWSMGPVATVLAGGTDEDRALARQLLRWAPSKLEHSDGLSWATWRLRAAAQLKDRAWIQRSGDLLARTVQQALRQPPADTCAGPIWFLCFMRDGAEGALAQAAIALLQAKYPVAQELAAKVAVQLSKRPTDPWWTWGSADAEVALLLTLLRRTDGRRATPFSVELDGKPLAQGSSAAPATVTITGGKQLRVRLPAEPGRACELHISGTLAVTPPSRAQGPAQLQRQFKHDTQGHSVVVSFRLARDARRVEIGLPLPAGLQLSGDARSRQATETDSVHTWRSWIDVGDPKQTTRPHLAVERDGLRLHWDTLEAGLHNVRIQLSARNPGGYHIASAWLKTADRRIWALTPPDRLTISP